ncbi:MAG: glycosyltransferase family 8 protein [Treponema sp.]|jgi:lipopolysaccharide biosynthesis glycosyltransferase|nr:glycosyltransferase family 8 protein [Treponema sp.]
MLKIEIPIIFSSNDFFVPYLSTMLQSVIENSNLSRFYHVFILNKDISQASMNLLYAQIARWHHFSLDFINISEYIKNYDFYTANRNTLTSEAYFRLLIPELFSEYKKVIYLDGDMICCADIATLYDIDIGEYMLASSRDIGGIKDYHDPKDKNRRCYNDEVLKLSNTDNYFNSGMLILNIPAFRKQFTVKEVLDFAVSREWRCHDQDILNVLCQNKTLLLPIAWNYIWYDDVQYLPNDLKEECEETKKAPKIIHFAGTKSERKPWESIVNVRYFELFWKYATRTPFFDIIIHRMNENRLIGLSYTEHIFEDIKNRRRLGLRFIVKCFSARFWKRWKKDK